MHDPSDDNSGLCAVGAGPHEFLFQQPRFKKHAASIAKTLSGARRQRGKRRSVLDCHSIRASEFPSTRFQRTNCQFRPRPCAGLFRCDHPEWATSRGAHEGCLARRRSRRTGDPPCESDGHWLAVLSALRLRAGSPYKPVTKRAMITMVRTCIVPCVATAKK
jgi:hypothetical protein